MGKKAYIKISVDNVPFDSIKDVANLCDMSKGAVYHALNTGQPSVKGYAIQKLGTNSYNLYKTEVVRDKKSAVKVKCLETGKVYPSIRTIANELGVNVWTMSVKMEETGKFIDKQGKSYVRLSPMVKKVDHTYGFKSSSITRNVNRMKSVKDRVSSLESVKVNSISQKDVVIQNLVKSANLLMDSKNYSQAAQILNVLNEFDK